MLIISKSNHIKIESYQNGELIKTHYECNLKSFSTEQDCIDWIRKVFDLDRFDKFKNSFLRKQQLNDKCIRFDYTEQDCIDYIDSMLSDDCYKINGHIYTVNQSVDHALSNVVTFERIDNLSMVELF